MSGSVPPGGAGADVPRDSLREAPGEAQSSAARLANVSRRLQLLRSTLEDSRAQAEGRLAENKSRHRLYRPPYSKKVPEPEPGGGEVSRDTAATGTGNADVPRAARSSVEASQPLELAASGQMARMALWLQLV